MFEQVDQMDVFEDIVDAIVNLSQFSPVPVGFRAAGSLSADQISFDDGTWAAALSSVQAWLGLDDDIPSVMGTQFLERLASLIRVPAPAWMYGPFGVTAEQIEFLDQLLEFLQTAVERAGVFANAIEEGVSRAIASEEWNSSWEEMLDRRALNSSILAEALTRPVGFLLEKIMNGTLDLAPAYQRDDVWERKTSQRLIESMLRGIPLPAFIILKSLTSNFEVVDGKQRLTAISRFVGIHPKALEKVSAISSEYSWPEAIDLFRNDYPKFKREFKRKSGKTLTAKVEDEFKFPFPLPSSSGTTLNANYSHFYGKYYCQIADSQVLLNNVQKKVSELFFENNLERNYLLSIIEFNNTDQRQIRGVFELYNTQGKKLNAEEIRNAAYHDVLLMRSIAFLAGDVGNADRRVDFLESEDSVDSAKALLIQSLFREYRFNQNRYKKSKILAWLLSSLLLAPESLSTANHIDAMLDKIVEVPTHPLRNASSIASLMSYVSTAMNAHLTYEGELWSTNFKPNGEPWPDLQLVGSLLGLTIAALVLGDELDGRVEQKVDTIFEDSQGKCWTRPVKTQTKQQWDYIAYVAIRICNLLDVSIDVASERIGQFGASNFDALVRRHSALIDEVG